MTSSNAIELLEEIKTEYRYNRYEEVLKDAIAIIKKYAEIKKIVDEFNATRDSSPMVERAYAEYTKIEKVECFDQILDLFKEK